MYYESTESDWFILTQLMTEETIQFVNTNFYLQDRFNKLKISVNNCILKLTYKLSVYALRKHRI